MIITIIFLPLLGAIVSGFLGFTIGKRGAQVITVSSIFISMLLSYRMFFLVGFEHNNYFLNFMPWIDCGLFTVNWGFLFDSLTVTMLLVVTTISSCVHIYSISYMAEDPHIPRFMSLLSFFTFCMLLLITADNLLVLFVGWEGVGICSYLLINFWHTRVEANKSSIKAIIMNRFGDIGIILAICLSFFVFKSVNFATIFPLVPYFYGMSFIFLGHKFILLDLLCGFLFIGVIGKSAQIGLHTWLPDAMEGPTPVSALIHAATMVTAGVFLLIRCSPIFEFSPTILMLICLVGSLTTFFAATAGMLQHDIKKVIAFSTCSQLGYMVFACGLSAYNLSLFHLYTHAFFKALLFLSAGAIIHGLYNEQDIRRMGGLIYIMPLTYIFFLIGSLALIGFPFLSGFYSKDAILETAFITLHIKGTFTFWLGTISALCTVFYSVRLLFLVFWAKTNSYKVIFEKAHEMDKITALPLTLLAFGSIFLGYFTKDIFIGMGTDFFRSSIFILPDNLIFLDAEFVPLYIKVLPTIISVFGSIVFYSFYIYLVRVLINLKLIFFNFYTFLINKWGVDTVYTNFFGVKVLNIAYECIYTLVDKGIIEKLGPKGIIYTLYNLSKKFMSLQTGYIHHYICGLILGLIWVVIIFIFTS